MSQDAGKPPPIDAIEAVNQAIASNE